MPKAILGWVQKRWNDVLEPVVRNSTVADEDQLRALWEQEMTHWRTVRHLDGDSLRNPVTNVRALIGQIPLTENNQWFNPSRQKEEHIGLKVFNLSEGEWVVMNDRNRKTTDERLTHQPYLRDPDAIVQRALPLLLSDDWTELVVGIALCTGRRLIEILSTATMEIASAYTVWFSGQAKTSSAREKDRYEIPTLHRAFLVIQALQKVRGLIDSSVPPEQVTQKYDQAVNEAVERLFGDVIPVRINREHLTIHALRSVHARISVHWFAPPNVSDIAYMAYIQGHRFITAPRVDPGASEEEIQKVRLNYSSHANYADYQIYDPTSVNGDGKQGTHLLRPGVQVIGVYQQQWQEWLAEHYPAQVAAPKRGRARTKPASAHKTVYSSMKPLLVTREWLDELREDLRQRLQWPEVKDNDLLLHLAMGYVLWHGGSDGMAKSQSPLSLESLEIAPDVRALLMEGMALAGAKDLVSFLLAAGEREARQLRSQVRQQDSERFRTMTTTRLKDFKHAPEAAQERIRRGVYAVMQWNAVPDRRPNDQWFITTQLLQRLVGGQKKIIASYLEAHQEEIVAHHTQFNILPHFNRKADPDSAKVPVPDESSFYPWTKLSEEVTTVE